MRTKKKTKNILFSIFNKQVKFVILNNRGDIKGACCNYESWCNQNNFVSAMIEAQEEHEKKIEAQEEDEKKIESSGTKAVSKYFTVFTACSFTMVFF